MGITTDKGDYGEAMVAADLQRQGHGVAYPLGHAWPFDLLVIRTDTGAIERVQVKYVTSDARSFSVRCRSHSAWVRHRYTAEEVDWIATYDATTDACYYLPSWVWDGMGDVWLRLAPPANGQRKGIRWAHHYRTLELAERAAQQTLPMEDGHDDSNARP